jgi:hypothetical protein
VPPRHRGRGGRKSASRGWVISFSRGFGRYPVEGELEWAGPDALKLSVPILFDYNYHPPQTIAAFSVSPDGRFLAFNTNQVLEENISMIENVR